MWYFSGLSAGGAPALRPIPATAGRCAGPHERLGSHRGNRSGTRNDSAEDFAAREPPAHARPRSARYEPSGGSRVRGARGLCSASAVPSQRRSFVSREPQSGRLRPPVASRETSDVNAGANAGRRAGAVVDLAGGFFKESGGLGGWLSFDGSGLGGWVFRGDLPDEHCMLGLLKPNFGAMPLERRLRQIYCYKVFCKQRHSAEARIF